MCAGLSSLRFDCPGCASGMCAGLSSLRFDCPGYASGMCGAICLLSIWRGLEGYLRFRCASIVSLRDERVEHHGSPEVFVVARVDLESVMARGGGDGAILHGHSLGS